MSYQILGSTIGHHHGGGGGGWAGFYPMPPWQWYNAYPAGYAGPDILVDPEFGIVNPQVLRHRVSGYTILGAMQKTAQHAPSLVDVIKDPSHARLLPHNLAHVDADRPAWVAISGGWKDKWSPQWSPSTVVYEAPIKVTVCLRDGTCKNYSGLDSVEVTDGVASTVVSKGRVILGADYTEAFFNAKKELDDVLVRADSSVNPIQHAAVVPYLDAEAAVIEGFRRGVDQKDKKTVDAATSAMKDLAGAARRFFINPATGEVKSQTKEASTKSLVEAGDDIQKFRKDFEGSVGKVMEILKWAAIIGGIVVALAVVGGIVVPLFVRSRMRVF